MTVSRIPGLLMQGARRAMESTGKWLQSKAAVESISDEELLRLLDFYTDLGEKLEALGPTFEIAWTPIWIRVIDLRKQRNNRELKKEI